jgi:hypothetical protein
MLSYELTYSVTEPHHPLPHTHTRTHTHQIISYYVITLTSGIQAVGIQQRVAFGKRWTDWVNNKAACFTLGKHPAWIYSGAHYHNTFTDVFLSLSRWMSGQFHRSNKSKVCQHYEHLRITFKGI